MLGAWGRARDQGKEDVRRKSAKTGHAWLGDGAGRRKDGSKIAKKASVTLTRPEVVCSHGARALFRGVRVRTRGSQ
eukprot:7244906-Prymnesium_polylepis.1